ncbi:MAG TPA: toll/interleukin-1 receptor domain-containing protein, partial [Dongiaceae bacterium]|nr:toll/interleukin-1 receptor domain-containing protein [Dongiaceae bacterium]
ITTNLHGANFEGAKINNAYFYNTILQEVNFSSAELLFATFLGGTNMLGVDFSESELVYTNFGEVIIGGSNFSNATMAAITLSDVDLSRVKGLETVMHNAPSTIGIDTLYRSRGKIPEKFLRDAGVPEELISYLPSLIGAVEPLQLQSCFISYSTKNQKFAERLHARMRQARLRVWFAPEDMKGGDYFFEQIERAIQLHDRLLLVLSEDSIQSKWVEREIRKTRKIERAEKRRKLFPITLTDYATLKKWECLDSDTGEDLAEEVRKYHIPDFSNWKNHDAFERAFARLEKDLRTSIGK